jgi:hypothetical protein
MTRHGRRGTEVELKPEIGNRIPGMRKTENADPREIVKLEGRGAGDSSIF